MVNTAHSQSATAVELIFIGDRFYSESGSRMSSIYTADGKQYHWGFVTADLRDGREVHIRPATDAEREPYERQLENITSRAG